MDDEFDWHVEFGSKDELLVCLVLRPTQKIFQPN